jgi:lysophospholipase L1-like esterase
LLVAAAALGATPRQQGSPVPDSAPIVLLGASFAEGWHPPAIAGHPVVVKGIGGQQTWELLERFDRDVTALAPRAVIIWGHINDVFRTPRDSMARGLARARESYAEMVRRGRAAGIEVILATEITMRRPRGVGTALRAFLARIRGKENYPDFINRHVSDLNVWLRSYAAEEGLLLLDLETALFDRKGRRRGDTVKDDGVHVTEAGYDAVSAYALPLLERHVAMR